MSRKRRKVEYCAYNDKEWWHGLTGIVFRPGHIQCEHCGAKAHCNATVLAGDIRKLLKHHPVCRNNREAE